MGAIIKAAKKRKTLTISVPKSKPKLLRYLKNVKLSLRRSLSLVRLNLQTHGKIDVLVP